MRTVHTKNYSLIKTKAAGCDLRTVSLYIYLIRYIYCRKFASCFLLLVLNDSFSYRLQMIAVLFGVLSIFWIQRIEASVLVADTTMSRMVELNADAPFCALYNDRGVIQRMVLGADPRKVRQISSNLVADLEETCKASRNKGKVSRIVWENVKQMFQIKKWTSFFPMRINLHVKNYIFISWFSLYLIEPYISNVLNCLSRFLFEQEIILYIYIN